MRRVFLYNDRCYLFLYSAKVDMEDTKFTKGIRIAAGSRVGLLRTIGDAIDHANKLMAEPFWDSELEAARQALYDAYDSGEQSKFDASRDAYHAALRKKKLAFD